MVECHQYMCHLWWIQIVICKIRIVLGLKVYLLVSLSWYIEGELFFVAVSGIQLVRFQF